MRRGWLLLFVWVAACAAGVVYAHGWRTDNRMSHWAGQTGRHTGYEVLRDRFGGDEAVLVRIDGFAEHDRAWLSRLGADLSGLDAVEGVADPLNLPGVGKPDLASIAKRPVARALDLVDPARPRIDIILRIAPNASQDQRNELRVALQGIARDAAAKGMRVRFAGHPIIAAALDAESARVELVFSPILVGLAYLGVALFLRSWALAALALLPAVLASVGARACLRALGHSSDLILVSTGPLCFVILLASTLHVVATFRRRYAKGATRSEAAAFARKEKLPAGSLAGLTTAVGFAVFLSSGLQSVRLLGITVALDVLLAVPLMFAGLPPLLARLPLRRPTESGRARHRWRWVAEWALRRRAALIVVAFAVLSLGAFASTRIRPQTNALDYFPEDDPTRVQFLELEAEGAALSSAEVLVRRTTWERFDLGAKLRAVDGVRGVFGPEAIVEEAGRIAPFALRQARFVAGPWARWSVRFDTTGAGPTRALVERLEAAARGAGNLVFVTGSTPLILDMQRELIGTLATSLGLTALATTLLFLLVTRRPRELLAALATNVMPVAAVLLGAWLFSVPLDGATVMVAAVVLGLAVDNTFHLMHGAGPRHDLRACLRAFDRVGEPAAVSSFALALGFFSIAFSGFLPTARFGALCGLGALFALVADLVLLPVLWVGAGRRMKT